MYKKVYLAFPLFLTGCIGPKKTIPRHVFTDTFQNQHNALSSQPSQTWWEQFNDPTLNQLIQQAITENYDLHIAHEKIEQIRAFYNFECAQLFPEINAALEVNTTRISKKLAQTSFLTQKNVSFFRLGFDSIWEIDFWGKIWRARKAALHALYAQIETAHLTQIILVAEVAQLYIKICSLNEQIAVINHERKIDNKLTQLEKQRFMAGLNSEFGLLTQQETEIDTHNQLLALRDERTRAYHGLAILLGLQPSDLPSLFNKKKIPYMHNALAVGIPSDLLRRRPDIRRAEQEIAQRYHLVGQAIAQWFPSFSLLGSLDSRASKSSEWFSHNSLSWSLGPSLNWPILNFGRIKANIQEKESQKRQALLAYSNSIINALKEVEDFLTIHFTVTRQLVNTTEKMDLTLQQAKLTKDRTCSGLNDTRSTLIAYKNYLQSKREEIALTEVISSNIASLYKALGGGW